MRAKSNLIICLDNELLNGLVALFISDSKRMQVLDAAILPSTQPQMPDAQIGMN
jgi:hypothetical protein